MVYVDVAHQDVPQNIATIYGGESYDKNRSFAWGSGCGAVGRAVASDTRGPRFESSHRQNLYVLSTVLKRRK